MLTVLASPAMAARSGRGEVPLSPLELEVMEVFWERGAQSVREALDRLPVRRRPAFTTVQTIVRRLEEKGALRRSRKVGNALVFEPTVARRAAYARIVGNFLRLFGGRARPLVAHLAETGRLGLEDLRAAEDILKGRRS